MTGTSSASLFGRLISKLTAAFRRAGIRSEKTLGAKRKRELERALGIEIKAECYFAEALTHRSALSIPSGGDRQSNERMEFLGDAILNFLVAELLFHRFSEIDEGQMTRLRSLLVNQHALAESAAKISLSSFLDMSNSAQQAIEKGYETIVSDAFEAVVAAIYLDGGIDAAKDFVSRTVMPREKQIDREIFRELDRNFKSALLELAQARALGAPKYNLLKEEGPDHDRTFTVEVLIGEKSRGTGSGKTKKAAEQAAAETAYESLRHDAAAEKTRKENGGTA